MRSMRAHAVSVCAVLAMIAGCGQIVGIEDLVSDEVPDTGAPAPIDSGSEVVFDAGIDVPAPIDSGPEADADKGFRRVFVTSDANPGNLGGVAGANGKCQAAAGRENLGGTWIAWISGDGKDAIDRIEYPGPFKLLDGREVAATKAQLASGTLTTPIIRNERNIEPNGTNDDKRVWTGTNGNGRAAQTCANWGNGFDATGVMGNLFDSTNGKWTNNGGSPPFPTSSCSAAGRLYCFEQ